MTNKELSQEERVDLWSWVIFYQFIQYFQKKSRMPINGDSLPLRKYNIEGKIIPALAIYHPSIHIGKSWKRWHPFVNLFLNKKFEMDK